MRYTPRLADLLSTAHARIGYRAHTVCSGCTLHNEAIPQYAFALYSLRMDFYPLTLKLLDSPNSLCSIMLGYCSSEYN